MSEAWPTEIRLADEGRRLRITFDSGEAFDILCETLRKRSPSAENRNLSDAEREALAAGRTIRIVKIEAVGNYAIRPTFSDGHETGIFTWRYLAELGRGAG
jgi:DUF971 family protein